jgi:antitoxin (DNA-binding transcriptional repressor) of toxin-antitoxin stability system
LLVKEDTLHQENNQRKFIMSNKTIDANKVQLSLKELLSLVDVDTEIIITEGNKPLARLISLVETEETTPEISDLLQPGLQSGTIGMSEDFDEPLSEEFLTQPHKRRQSGSAKGLIWMSPDFDQPLEDFDEYMG